MRSISCSAFGVLLLSAVAFHAQASGTNKVCNGRKTDVVFAVIHEDSDDPDARCDLQGARCHVTLQGWYTLKPGVCTEVAVGSRWESLLSIFVKDAADGRYRPEAFPVNEKFDKDRSEKNSGVVNVNVCLPVGPFRRQLPGTLAPLVNPVAACGSGEAFHPINYVMRSGPDTHVVLTVN
ncbi:hypothetical protein WKW77_05630 [Variovorax ureilyticus]|uniref:Secreted protein n=1 Tax=Variovorax ureilyticus TaxID=1836198 RepID=A0ABU8VB33_9BURK